VTPSLSFSRGRLSAGLAALLILSAALAWVGYRPVVEWERAAALVAERRADAASTLLVSALTRDMRGAQLSVLAAADRDGLIVGPAVDLLHPIGSAFARYPYLDAFFSWRDDAAGRRVVFYTRAERQPRWLPATPRQQLFPVVVGQAPALATSLVARVAADLRQSRRVSVFDLDIDGSRYQVVASLAYGDSLRERPAGVLGFLVSLDWTRQHYFGDLADQTAHIEGDDNGVRFLLHDDAQQLVAGTGSNGEPAVRREFPMAFFDPVTVAAAPPADLRMPTWTAVAIAEADPTLAAAEQGARRTLVVAAVMALALAIGVWLSLHAARANARLADMRADFVSAVTHELKTPIANMRALHETLASGRGTLEMSREYGEMGMREATRLTRLVDNLLAYARITDVADAYAFDAVALEGVVDRSLQEFAPHLTHARFEVHVELPEELPLLRADATALGLLINNLIDNAIRYSRESRWLSISALQRGHTVALEVADRGIGIPEDELGRVTRKFFRGRGSNAGGSGLGLAIVDRIVADHGGALEIRSVAGSGTTVVVTLPVAGSP